ncbi:hypothetical protein N7510_008077 [Penicillium lagena]|uniref:uncharacterized protein n=1 Tax=Penicillium lagena TaxID=94218 RepID=UPI00254105EF|nr:uncharacterized protein N7510_008077 [Penicillium lagena]KAJ5611358.1 hypothetical protein N7510_008077 [Penicillium lagena]
MDPRSQSAPQVYPDSRPFVCVGFPSYCTSDDAFRPDPGRAKSLAVQPTRTAIIGRCTVHAEADRLQILTLWMWSCRARSGY